MIRLQKFLAACGAASRREAEKLIAAGRVTVNGRTAVIGQSVSDTDEVRLDGVNIFRETSLVYIMLNKPRGYITTMKDDKGRRSVIDLVQDVPERVFPVGRLDYESEGLLLLTNDGELANRITHPRFECTKTYHVSVSGDIDAAIPFLRRPITIDGEAVVTAKRVEKRSETSLLIEIGEGRNRQIRKMCEAAGLGVKRLTRVSQSGLSLGGLKSGDYRYLTPHELKILKSSAYGRKLPEGKP